MPNRHYDERSVHTPLILGHSFLSLHATDLMCQKPPLPLQRSVVCLFPFFHSAFLVISIHSCVTVQCESYFILRFFLHLFSPWVLLFFYLLRIVQHFRHSPPPSLCTLFIAPVTPLAWNILHPLVPGMFWLSHLSLNYECNRDLIGRRDSNYGEISTAMGSSCYNFYLKEDTKEVGCSSEGISLSVIVVYHFC